MNGFSIAKEGRKLCEVARIRNGVGREIVAAAPRPSDVSSGDLLILECDAGDHLSVGSGYSLEHESSKRTLPLEITHSVKKSTGETLIATVL